MRRWTRGEAGGPSAAFTLIELLVVIVILGALAAIVVFSVGGVSDKGSHSACRSDRSTVEVASEAYFAQHHTYAPDMQTLVDSGLIREIPVAGNYTISYDSTDGSVTATGC